MRGSGPRMTPRAHGRAPSPLFFAARGRRPDVGLARYPALKNFLSPQFAGAFSLSPRPEPRGRRADRRSLPYKYAPCRQGAAPLGAPPRRLAPPGLICGDFCPRVRVSRSTSRPSLWSSARRFNTMNARRALKAPETALSSEAPRGGVIVPPDRVPGPPECEVTSLARGRRASRCRLPGLGPGRGMPHLRHRARLVAPSLQRPAKTPLGEQGEVELNPGLWRQYDDIPNF